MIWTFIILGFATIVPWNASIPNHLGYYSTCSSAPISTIMMFVVAAAFYLYWKRETVWPVYGAIIIFLIISGMFGYWILFDQLPLNRLNVKINVSYVWSGYDSFYERNISRIGFNITFSNPTDRELSFQVERDAFYINNTKLKPSSFDYGAYWGGQRIHTIQPHGEISFDSHLTISQRVTRTEDGRFENFWLSLAQQPFTLSTSSILSNRYYYGPTIEYSFVVAARTCAASCTYSPWKPGLQQTRRPVREILIRRFPLLPLCKFVSHVLWTGQILPCRACLPSSEIFSP